MAQGATQARELLAQSFFASYPEEVARVLDGLPASEIVRALEGKPASRSAAVLERLTGDTGSEVLEHVSAESARGIVPALEPARAAALLARLDEDTRDKLLALLEPGAARDLRAFMAYPPDSAGNLMDPRVTTFRPETTVEDAVTRLRNLRDRRVSHIFLIDADGHLVGTVAVQDLAVASPAERLEQLRVAAPVSIQATAPREEVVQELTDRKLTSIPVIDYDGRVIGVIRGDALVRAVQDEVSADIQSMVGASKDERALSPVSFAVRKRLPWLQVNLLTAFLAAAVVGIFEGTIARFTALAVLLPVVAGQSGNTGAQALAVTMRGLFMREIRTRQWLRVSLKEIKVAAINGVGVALTTSLAVYVWSRSLGLALVIGLSMVISMVAAGLAGALTPIALTRIGQDPAQSSSIILTTITDVTGFFSFLGIATILAAML